MATSTQPIYIVSMNNTTPRAKELVAILIVDLRDEYNLIHVADTDSIFNVKSLLESLVIVPQVLTRVQKLAEALILGLKTIAIPPGLNVTQGGDAVVEFLKV